MSTPTSLVFKSATTLLAIAVCAACTSQVHERSAAADVFVPCWGDAPPRMRHVDWALSQRGLALDLPAREQMLRAAQRICATGAAHADFALRSGSSPADEGWLSHAGGP
ncbi:MAG: hypothetical protein JSS59_01305 [Proteobacteria bacterium]|nr:hypothetical protein [Pseudomonadota bacterium]